MTEHLSEQQIKNYREKTLLPAERLAISDHLQGCEECRSRLRGGLVPPAVRFLEADIRTALAEEPTHLLFEEMAAYVDGNASLADREIVESHIETCPLCAKELRELRGFRAMLSTYPPQTLEPARPLTFWERCRDFLRLPAGQFTLRTALPVAAALLLALYIKSSRSSLPPPDQTAEIARLKQQVAKAAKQGELYRQETQARQAQVARLTQQNAHLIKQLTAHTPQTVARNLIQDSQGNLKWQILVRKEDQSAVIVALTGKLRLPSSVEDVLPDGRTLMGGTNTAEHLTLVSPVSTFVLSERPTLRWKPVTGAIRYQVSVVTAGRESVASASVNSGTEWTPSKGLLKPGVTYQWTVEAYDKPDTDAEVKPVARAQVAAKFAILDAKQRAEVAQAQTQYAASHLLLGISYASRGLLEEARREFDAQLQVNPKDVEARRLLKELDKKRAVPVKTLPRQ